MDDRKRYETARPSNVGPHDVNKDQADPQARRPVPEKMYNNEVGGQAAIVGPQGGKKQAQEPVKKD
ncbi:hypothetical protein QMO56_06225 [Roseomonas sp. E05]|uniref:hypothetical protein n=1 Tax=Roseomonas sp. E05 TaxID=3046310 RepID=UPI0024BB1E7B|nr:hypothetical protein [Roseomonas sp. E05]MDJ0387703.1 hypothetical protein [Roseomonas sp. E05]